MKYLMAVFIHHFVRNPPVYKRDNIRNVNLKPTRFRGISFFSFTLLNYYDAQQPCIRTDSMILQYGKTKSGSGVLVLSHAGNNWCIKHEDIFRNFIIGLQEIRLLLLRKAWQPIAKSIFKPTVLIQIHFL